jgi:hypothetical protein
MQPHQRRSILSTALDLQPGKEVTRDTVKAALWSTFGYTDESESRVALLLSVVDAYTDARSRRTIHHWAGSGQPLPPLNADLAQAAAVRRTLMLLTIPATISVPHQPTRLAAGSRETVARGAATRPTLTVVPLPEEYQEALESLIENDVPPSRSRIEPLLAANTVSKFFDDVHWGSVVQTAPVDRSVKSADIAGDSARDNNDDDTDEDTTLYPCHVCGIPKQRGAYYRSSSIKRGFDGTCKECKGKKSKEYRQNKKNKELAQSLDEMVSQMNLASNSSDDVIATVNNDDKMMPVIEAEASLKPK